MPPPHARLCRYSLAAQANGTRAAAQAQAKLQALTETDHTHWPLSLLLAPRCPAACVELAVELCQTPAQEMEGELRTHGGARSKRWLRRSVGSAYHAKDEL